VPDNKIDRKIAVIFATDVVGYSSAMELDEVQTLKNLRACRNILEDLFQQHGGHVFNTAGDSVLAEFSSAVSAVVCASEFQKLMKERNKSVENFQKMEFRIGINMGDVVKEDGNLYGEGVNIAARLEALSKPNGICLSKNIYELVKTKTNFSFDDLGEQKMKNTIVHAFDINTGDNLSKFRRKKIKTIKLVPVFSILCFLLIFVFGYFFILNNKNSENNEKIIAVMPFVNSAGDSSQDYFVDGLTEDLIIDLSKIGAFSVISRNSVFNYKNKEYSDKEVAKTLNADFLLKGNARLRGDLLRLNIELVNSKTGSNIWAERFEEPKEEIFNLQDSLVINIVEQLSVKLTDKEEKKIINAKAPNLEAYDIYKKGLASQDRSEARKFYKKAISIDPTFGRAYGSMAISLAFDFANTNQQSLTSAEKDILKNEAINYAKKAIEINPDEAHSYFSLALIYAQTKMINKSKEQNEKALKLEPENLLALQMKATNQINDGFFKDGLITYQKVRKIDPLFPIFVLQGEARAYLALDEFEKALNLSEEALVRNPRSSSAMLNYIVSAWKLGKREDAKWQMEELILNSNNLILNKNDFATRINNYPWHQVNKDLVISVYDEIIEDGS
tara:strand:+ start:195 stop:2042 length:1848 start_codon:yes stop_codon:yes gene_type:complete